ncbi:AoPex11B [Apiospora aurea]|uniref:AoPex11B n=1 Tax=Apiospora aurea TaxID=335848 RepID=A0ABR1PYQ5_9PEZI
MAVSTFDKFVRFTTDSVGLERTLRLFQAIIQILFAYPLLQDLVLLPLLNYNQTADGKGTITLATTQPILSALRQRLGLVRRTFRLFRCLESFRAAQLLYTSHALTAGSSAGKKQPSWVQTEVWLEVLSRTFNGMYLLLEASTMAEALQIEGLAVWSLEWASTLTVEAQRFWLFALVCSVFSGLLKMLKVMAYTPVPEVGDVFSEEKEKKKPQSATATAIASATATATAVTGDSGATQEKKKETDEDEVFDMVKEQERLRRIVQKRKAGRVMWRRAVRAQISGLGCSVTASALDIVLPGAAVGWINADPGTVGIAMFVTTILTGMEVWERCERELMMNQ